MSKLHPQLKSTHRSGVAQTYESPHDKELSLGEKRALVEEWTATRISRLPEVCDITEHRAVALLGVTRDTFYKLAIGDYTPTQALCLRMQKLVDAKASGELDRHQALIPAKAEMKRRMAAFRSWFTKRKATEEMPQITVTIEVRWGDKKYQTCVLPADCMPKLRVRHWDGLIDVCKALSMSMRKLALQQTRLLWTEMDKEYWRRYVTDTLPEIVEAKAKGKHGVRNEENLPAPEREGTERNYRRKAV